jgi:uncharacterized membrane protein
METKEHKEHSFIGVFTKDIRKRLIAGALVLLPVYITFHVLKFIFTFAGGTMVPVVKRLLMQSAWVQLKIPDSVLTPLMFLLGLIMAFMALYFAGAFATNFFGRRIIKFAEGIVDRTPLVKSIYNIAKQFIHSVTALPGRSTFKRTVMLDFFKSGCKVLGFVTGSLVDKEGNKRISVFVPTAPNPTTGFVVLVNENEVMETNLTIEEGIKLVCSGGVVTPNQKFEEIEKLFPTV